MIFNTNKRTIQLLLHVPPSNPTTEESTGEARFFPVFCGSLFPGLAYVQVDWPLD